MVNWGRRRDSVRRCPFWLSLGTHCSSSAKVKFSNIRYYTNNTWHDRALYKSITSFLLFRSDCAVKNRYCGHLQSLVMTGVYNLPQLRLIPFQNTLDRLILAFRVHGLSTNKLSSDANCQKANSGQDHQEGGTVTSVMTTPVQSPASQASVECLDQLKLFKSDAFRFQLDSPDIKQTPRTTSLSHPTASTSLSKELPLSLPGTLGVGYPLLPLPHLSQNESLPSIESLVYGISISPSSAACPQLAALASRISSRMPRDSPLTSIGSLINQSMAT